jgi:NDP-sugar pyrophosphorylase family protein/lipopolysaccharide/colanic/teichoic acid biosynthesis glycosyltransferase
MAIHKDLKAVILAGGHETRLRPLVTEGSKVFLPVANLPLLEYLLAHLEKQGITDVILCLNGDQSSIRHFLTRVRPRRLRLIFAREKTPLGTAGALAAVRHLIGDSPFLVISSNTLAEIDVADLYRFHRNKDALATCVIAPMRETAERVEVQADGTVRNLHRCGPADRWQREFYPVGIYLFDPEVFKLIGDADRYVDLKEQLFPRLRDAGLPVYAYLFEGYWRNLNGIEDYFLLNRDLVLGRTNGCSLGREIRPGVWAGEGVTIAPDASLVPPLVLGAGCVVGPRAQIIGPTSIGEGCTIEAGAQIRESVLWSGVRIGRGSTVSYSILARNTTVGPHVVLHEAVLTHERAKRGRYNFLDDPFRAVPSPALPRRRSLSTTAFAAAKRLIDLLGAVTGIALTWPLMLFAALAVRIDSPGPILFRQKRLGKEGREFTLLKFRSMVVDAEDLLTELRSYNEMDGPVFKMSEDPRLTRVGRILRKTSLDELPQLFNVLKGDMSLVGPRPLTKEELRLNPSWWETRLRVKPGVTGLWQIYGRNNTTFQDWIRYDILYVENQSLWLDFKILLLTPFRVLTGTGAR